MAVVQPTRESRDSGLSVIKPVVVPPAHEVVVNHLRRIIHLGEVQAGARLPPERQLAAQLGVSRTTLREALHILQIEGYVDIRLGQHGGVFVRTTEFPTGRLSRQWVRSLSEFEQVYELRAVVEGFAAKAAAEKIQPAALATLEKTIESMKSDGSIGAFRQEDFRFHITIARAPGLDLLRETVEHLRAALFIPFQLFELEEMTTSTIREHQQILDALKAHDSKAAEAFMVAHITHSASAVRATVDNADHRAH
jgi:GntR family transcriptional repressor for pyruvate dehydrogenase complex